MTPSPASPVVVVDSSAERDHRDFDIDGDGALYEWDGSTDLSSSAQVGMLDPSYHALPAKLHDAANPAAEKAYQLDQQLGLKFERSYYTDWGGWGEKWIHSESGTWYFITPDGALYEWNRSLNLSGSTQVETLDPSFHALPSKLHDAASPLVEKAFRLDQQLGLKFNGSYHEDWGGWGEKWIYSESRTWYFITPAGAFYQWDGNDDLGSSLQIEILDSSYHTDPTKLHDALDPLPAKARTVDEYLSLRFENSYYQDWGGWDEKWIYSESRTWYFITPDGALYQWDGNSDLSSSLQIEMFDSSYYADPSLLHDAPEAAMQPTTEFREWSYLLHLLEDDWEGLDAQ